MNLSEESPLGQKNIPIAGRLRGIKIKDNIFNNKTRCVTRQSFLKADIYQKIQAKSLNALVHRVITKLFYLKFSDCVEWNPHFKNVIDSFHVTTFAKAAGLTQREASLFLLGSFYTIDISLDAMDEANFQARLRQ